jgi:hypothetical protein
LFVRITFCGEYSFLDVPYMELDIPCLPPIDTEFVLSTRENKELINIFSLDEYYLSSYCYNIKDQVITVDRINPNTEENVADRTIQSIKSAIEKKDLHEIERYRAKYPFSEKFLLPYPYVNRIVYHSEKRIFILGLNSEPFYG